MISPTSWIGRNRTKSWSPLPVWMVHDSNQTCKPRALESDWPEATTRCDMITNHILRTPDPRYFIKKPLSLKTCTYTVQCHKRHTVNCHVTLWLALWQRTISISSLWTGCTHTTVPSPMFFLCIEMVWNKLNCSTSLEINILSKLRDISSLTNVQSIRQISTGDGAYTISDDQMDPIYAWRHVTSLMRSIIIFWILNK